MTSCKRKDRHCRAAKNVKPACRLPRNRVLSSIRLNRGNRAGRRSSNPVVRSSRIRRMAGALSILDEEFCSGGRIQVWASHPPESEDFLRGPLKEYSGNKTPLWRSGSPRAVLVVSSAMARAHERVSIAETIARDSPECAQLIANTWNVNCHQCYATSNGIPQFPHPRMLRDLDCVCRQSASGQRGIHPLDPRETHVVVFRTFVSRLTGDKR